MLTLERKVDTKSRLSSMIEQMMNKKSRLGFTLERSVSKKLTADIRFQQIGH